MSEENEETDIPDLPGLIFKDMTFKDNADVLIGKYIVGFAKNGRKVIKVIGWDAKENKVSYEVFAGLEEQNGKKFKALIEPEMPFYAYAEEALPYALSDN